MGGAPACPACLNCGPGGTTAIYIGTIGLSEVYCHPICSAGTQVCTYLTWVEGKCHHTMIMCL